jgi:hypothetical protein
VPLCARSAVFVAAGRLGLSNQLCHPERSDPAFSFAPSLGASGREVGS